MKKHRKKYQLILQLSHAGLEDFDALIKLEDALIAKLGPGFVDGHDCGSGEMNIFIHSDFPEAAFSRCLGILNDIQVKGLKAAYRPLDGDAYTVLWPKNSNEPFVVK